MQIRRSTLLYNILYTTTIAGARALGEAVRAMRAGPWDVAPLQAYHKTGGGRGTRGKRDAAVVRQGTEGKRVKR